MTVRAKFRVQNVEVYKGNYGGKVTLEPVVGGSPENDAFYKATPAGSIVLETVNPDCLVQNDEGTSPAFEIGAEYYVDFTKA